MQPVQGHNQTLITTSRNVNYYGDHDHDYTFIKISWTKFSIRVHYLSTDNQVYNKRGVLREVLLVAWRIWERQEKGYGRYLETYMIKIRSATRKPACHACRQRVQKSINVQTRTTHTGYNIVHRDLLSC